MDEKTLLARQKGDSASQPTRQTNTQQPPSPPTLSWPRLLTCIAFALTILTISCLNLPSSFHLPGIFSTPYLPSSTSSIEERALRVLKKTPLIDGHNDLLMMIRYAYKNRIYDDGEGGFKKGFEEDGLRMQTDSMRLEEGKVGGVFWSLFMPCPRNGSDWREQNYYDIVRETLNQLDLYARLGTQYPKYFSPTLSSSQAHQHFSAKRLIAPAAIEGLHQIGNSLSTLRLYHSLGVRYATLTWNCHNIYADAAIIYDPDTGEATAKKPYWKGVSSKGRDLIREMNRLGMMVDLSHVSVDTMRHVLNGSDDGEWTGSIAPPIFSHSSAFTICPHPRNVPDEILQLVKKRNSVVMINFNPDFISCLPPAEDSTTGLPTYYPQNNTIHQVVRHVLHIGELIGFDHVGIGSDFDGISDVPAGLEDVSKFPKLVEELLKAGVSEEDAGKVVGGNLLRVWEEVDAVKEKLEKEGARPMEDELENEWATEEDVDATYGEP